MTPQIKESDYIKTWALMWLCSTVGGFLVGAIVGGILGGAMGVAGIPVSTIRIICGVVGFVLSVPISYLFFRLFVSRFIVQKLTSQITAPAVPPSAFVQP